MLPWNYYYAEFYASSDWEIIDIPLSSFKYSRNQNDNLNSKVIRSIGIVAYGKEFFSTTRFSKYRAILECIFQTKKKSL